MASNQRHKPKWKWLDDTNTWQPYDDETNNQIELAYNSTVICVKLNKGSYFGKYENQIYTVVFDRNKHPIECKQRNNQTNSCRPMNREYKSSPKQPKHILSSNIIDQITPQLTIIYNRKVVLKAFDIFNATYNKNSNIINSTNAIINEIIEIIERNQLIGMKNDDEKYDMQHQAQKHQDPYHSTYEIGDWIEIFAHNVWIPAEIIDTEPITDANVKGFDRAKIMHVEYQDTKTLQDITIKLHGLHDKNKFRVLASGLYSDAHSFNFDYTSKNNNNKSSNAKHPAAYINRQCYKCKGMGIIYIKNNNKCNNCHSTGTAHLKCNKCDNGIHKHAFSMVHDKCNGSGCGKCNDTGMYPLEPWNCRVCKGTGIYKVKCNVCNGIGNTNYNEQKQKQCPKCIGGYFVNKIVGWIPKRDFDKRVHGKNGKQDVMRLYHATDKSGADGIRESGVMLRGQTGAYGGAIYFAVSPQMAKERARQEGYLVIADVYIGKCMQVAAVSPDMDFNTLNGMGYDSIKGTWSSQGIEYVVYCWDQVWVHVVVPFNKVDFSKLK